MREERRRCDVGVAPGGSWGVIREETGRGG